MKKKYYDLGPILSYNALLNFVLGGRSIGKTFAVKKYQLQRFLKTGSQFIYLRRSREELKRLDKEKFFTSDLLKQVFPDYDLTDIEITPKKALYKLEKIDDDKVHIIEVMPSGVLFDKRRICYFKALSTFGDLKGSEYDEVESILFDEVLIDPKSRVQYLKGEFNMLMSLASTVFRLRDNVKIFLLSNFASLNNPYMLQLKIFSKEKQFVNSKNLFVVEFAKEKMLSIESNPDNRFIQLLDDLGVIDEVEAGEFIDDVEDHIIGRLKGKKELLYRFDISGQTIGLFSCQDKIYIDFVNDNTRTTYTVDKKDARKFNYLNPRHYIIRHIIKFYLTNRLHYATLELQILFTEVIKHGF